MSDHSNQTSPSGTQDGVTMVMYNQTNSQTVSPNTDNESSSTGNHLLAYILIPLGAVVFVALLAAIVVFLFRKTKLEKLRHHLMPLYSFDPGEEDGDWESELLEDQDKEMEMALRIESPSPTSPNYMFSSNRR